MALAIADNIKQVIRESIMWAYIQSKDRCSILSMHLWRDIYPRFFRAALQEKLAEMFPGSLPVGVTSNFYIIRLLVDLDIIVVTENDLSRGIQKNKDFDETGYLPFDELRKPYSDDGHHKERLIFALDEEGQPCSVILRSSDAGFDPLMIINGRSDFLQLEAAYMNKTSTAEEVVGIPENDFMYIRKKQKVEV